MFKIDGIVIEFMPDAISAIAKKAMDLKTGARGLRTIIESKMTKLMYEAPSLSNVERIIVNKNFIEDDNGEAEIIFKKKEVC